MEPGEYIRVIYTQKATYERENRVKVILAKVLRVGPLSTFKIDRNRPSFYGIGESLETLKPSLAGEGILVEFFEPVKYFKTAILPSSSHFYAIFSLDNEKAINTENKCVFSDSLALL